MATTLGTGFNTPRWIGKPLTHITPMSLADGATYERKLDWVYNYLVNLLVPELDGILDEWFEQYKKDHAELLSQINGVKDEWQTLFDQFMVDVTASLEGLNDQAAANLVNNSASLLYQALDKNFVSNDEIFVNVLDHGAKGDGVTDDRLAVMAALDVIADNGGGTLFFPSGYDFWWSDIVALEPRHSNLHVLGYGAKIGKKNLSDARYAIFSSKSMGARGYGSGVRNVVFEGIEFYGDLSIGRDACAFAGNHAENIYFRNVKFTGMHGRGHIADLAGCRNVHFESCVFAGATNNRTGNYLRSEAIQLDISAAGAASAPDEPGSWSGLPTIDVYVDHCQFLPLTVNGVKYPAPKPLGAHTRRELAWFENINFTYNKIVDPLFDVTSELPGDLHFVCSRNIKIIGNEWRLTTTAAHIAIGLYPVDRGTVQNSNNEESGTVNPVVQITPMPVTNVEIAGNKFYGFSSANLDRGYIIHKNFEGNFNQLRGKSLDIHDNYYECVSPNAGMSALLIEDCDNIRIHGEEVLGKVRLVQARRNTAMMISGSTTSEPGTQSINITDCTGFVVTGNSLLSGGTLPCVLVNNGSSDGAITSNIFAGGSSNPTLIAGTNMSTDNNIVSVYSTEPVLLNAWAHWGDSMTQASTSNDWVSKFASLSKVPSYNGGLSGATAAEISSRMRGDLGRPYRNRKITINAGRNGVKTMTTESIMVSIREMVAHTTVPFTGFIFDVPVWSDEVKGSADRAKLDALNAQIQQEFPGLYLPIYGFLQTQEAADAAGITFTENDLTNITNGITPGSFRRDINGHLSEAGAVAVAYYLNKSAKARGL